MVEKQKLTRENDPAKLVNQIPSQRTIFNSISNQWRFSLPKGILPVHLLATIQNMGFWTKHYHYHQQQVATSL